MKYLKWRGHAKDVLYNYPANRELLQQLRADVLYGQGQNRDECYRRGGISNPTYCKAAQLTQGRLEQMGREVAAVENLLRSFDLERRDDAKKLAMVQMLYFHCTHTLYGAAAVLGLSERTLLRWNQDILTRIALELGWV